MSMSGLAAYVEGEQADVVRKKKERAERLRLVALQKHQFQTAVVWRLEHDDPAKQRSGLCVLLDLCPLPLEVCFSSNIRCLFHSFQPLLFL